MLIVSLEHIPGTTFEVRGFVCGASVKTQNFARDFRSCLKGCIGGNVAPYERLMAEARNDAFHKMKAEARAIGADAILGVKFSTSMIMQGASEVMVFGTGIKWLIGPDN
eukprot:Trichotokara_eunicae@DN8701_c0_g1_i1.p1